MLRDLYLISKIETAPLSAAVETLGSLDGLGSQASLEALISSALGSDNDKNIAKAIRRIVSNLVPSSVSEVLTAIGRWVDVDREHRQDFFSEQSIDRLIANLDVLVVKNALASCFERQKIVTRRRERVSWR